MTGVVQATLPEDVCMVSVIHMILVRLLFSHRQYQAMHISQLGLHANVMLAAGVTAQNWALCVLYVSSHATAWL